MSRGGSRRDVIDDVREGAADITDRADVIDGVTDRADVTDR